MDAIDFPDFPQVNDIFTFGSCSWAAMAKLRNLGLTDKEINAIVGGK